MTKFNPAIHHRRSIRLKGYDYSQNGLYFITICCQNRICRFGHIENKKMILNEYGEIAYNEWGKLAERFPNFELNVFQIMPNHMHGIIVLNNNNASVGSGFTPDRTLQYQGKGQPQGIAPTNDKPIGIDPDNGQQQGIAPTNDKPQRTAPTNDRTVSDILGAYKSLVANGCLEIFKSKNKTMGKLWQRDFYEHIIRNEQAYVRISEYIKNNPAKWAEDKFYKS
jgi:putative transposase